MCLQQLQHLKSSLFALTIIVLCGCNGTIPKDATVNLPLHAYEVEEISYSYSKFFPYSNMDVKSARVTKQEFNLTPKEELGKYLFFDNIASPDNMSCAECHAPEVGFTGPDVEINIHGGVYHGAVSQRFGNRKPPSAAYATLSPVFYYDDEQGSFIGGNFWDGRATGELLENPAADQALGPFLNPVEQNNASKESVLKQVAKAKYAKLWEEVWGEPIRFETPMDIDKNFDRIGLAIAAYEGSEEVNQFSSKYDKVMAGEARFTEDEDLGYDLFIGKGACTECHPEPLFTNFAYENLGIPKNPDNPFYAMDNVYLEDGTAINPEGSAWVDKGLGGFLETRPEWADMAAENYGKHKVPTLRNVGKANSDDFPKAFMHNGVFKSLAEVVHFYNTRDIKEWPAPEVEENVNTILIENLELTQREEAALVAFLMTLSDGYVPEK